MRTWAVVIALCVGVLLGYGVTSGAKPAAVSTQPHECKVAKALGAFKAVSSESWLLFEDEGGTLRAVDYGCHVQRVISRH
jgi:hypothetical protein